MQRVPREPRHAAIPATPASIRVTNLLVAGTIVALLALAVLALVTMNLPTWSRIAGGITRNAVPLLRGFIEPNTGVFGLATGAMLETVYMAVIGTVVGAVLAFPMAFLAANNLLGSRLLAFPGKTLLVGIRTFPEILFAIIFVSAVGPGPIAGILAMGVNSVGFLGKVFSDVVEAIDSGPSEAIRAAGGNDLHVFFYSVVPQVLPEFASYVLYRFEINLRAASILGMVGAGGIGAPLIQRLQFRRWDEISMMLIVIVVVIVVVDTLSSSVRRRLV
jgi:phosphonate transport system permease protein